MGEFHDKKLIVEGLLVPENADFIPKMSVLPSSYPAMYILRSSPPSMSSVNDLDFFGKYKLLRIEMAGY